MDRQSHLGIPLTKNNNQTYEHRSKRWEGVLPGSKSFQIVQMGHRGVGGGSPIGHVPNAAHKILFKKRLITIILFNLVARYLFC